LNARAERENMATEFHWHCSERRIRKSLKGRENGPVNYLTYPQARKEKKQGSKFFSE
jgi:hypothetical protein